MTWMIFDGFKNNWFQLRYDNKCGHEARYTQAIMLKMNCHKITRGVLEDIWNSVSQRYNLFTIEGHFESLILLNVNISRCSF